MIEISSQEENTFFQYINLNALDYFFEIKDEIFDPSLSLSAYEEHKLPEKKRDKMDKSVISTSSSKTSKNKLSKKAKKNQQKKKMKQKELDLELVKKDSKNGIYSLKPIKEKDKKKEKNQGKQKMDPQKLQILQQKMTELAIKEAKKVVESIANGEELEINTSSGHTQGQNQNQNSHKNKKGKNKNKNKNKENNYKEKELEKEQKMLNKIKEKEEKEGNKKVDDFIKSIKEKKEKKEKEMQQENIKLHFYTKYKYLFTFDPSNRLKLRDENSIVDEDIIKDLFVIISTKFIDDKEIIKEFLILIDSICEILYSTPKNRENEKNLELFLTSCVNLINKSLPNNTEENQFILIINVFYSMIKAKLELQNEYENIFNKLYTQINKNVIIDSLNLNIKNNDKYDIKENHNLINDLFCYFLIDFFNNNKEEKNKDLNCINDLIKEYTVILSTKRKDQKNEIYQDENIELFRTKYNTISLLMKFFTLFDIKKSNFYSLNIKATKELESYFKSQQQILINSNIENYMNIILLLLQQFIYNMDLFYELDNTLYDKIFNLLLILVDNPPFNDDSNISILSNKNKFIDNLKLNELSLNSDDSISKYMMILMKLFKFYNADNNKGEYNNTYIKYFQKVLNFVFEISQTYLKEKYISLLQRELKSKIENIKDLIKGLFSEIINIINQIIKTKDITLIKNYKNISKFFGKYDQFIEEIILYIKNNFNKGELNNNDEIKIILFLSILDNNKKMIKKFIEEVDCDKILFINQNLVNHNMHNYLGDEINCLNNIIKEYFNEKKEECQKAIVVKFINEIKNENIYDAIELWSLIISQNINLNIRDINSLRNENNFRILDGIILYLLINGININEIQEFYKCDRDFIKEIQDVNNVNGHFKGSGYIANNKLNQLINLLIELNKVDILLKKEPKFFKPYKEPEKAKKEESKESEKKEEIKKEEIKEEKKEQKKEEEKKEVNENKNGENEKEGDKNKEKEEKDNENKISEEKKEENKKEVEKHINMDLILHIFSEILSLKELKSVKDKVTDKNMSDKLSQYNLSILFYFNYIEKFIYYIFLNDEIFNNLKKSPKFLSAFIILYISFKESLKLNKAYYNDYLSKSQKLDPIETKNILIMIKLLNECEINLTNLLISRCSSQLVYLFPEKEIFNLLQTNNRKFLKTVTDNLASVYKTQILSVENVKTLLNKAQDEEEDYLQDVIYSIFGKETIKYLEDPKDIIKTLRSINEGMKYDLIPNKNNFVSSIYPYFYIWKAIMMKIEYGFKLYTTDKSKVEVIENYKTLLRFITSYLEKNSLLYEMFLLILVSLVHLIDQQDYENDIDNSDPINNDFQHFDESQLTNEFDHNTYIFLLSILYKFVKIFPSLIKYYYDESQNKLKFMFKNLIFTQILPKLLLDVRSSISSNAKILLDNGIILNETILKNVFEFNYQLNDEIALTISVKIPPIFPLKKLEVNVRCNAQLNENKLFNIKMNLNHTLNSSLENICDNLIIWSEDAKQLVVLNNEPCPICFYYVNSTDKSLPNLQCHTCKKKFHNFCMKEWFKSQQHLGKETCPMCRGEWKLRLRK